MTLLKDTLITPAGLYQRVPDYVDWKIGEPTITLDGDFTIVDLQWLIDHISSKQSDSTDQIDEIQ